MTINFAKRGSALFLAVVLSLAGLAYFAPPSHSASDRLPDLRMAQIRDFRVDESTLPGEQLLRFSTTIVNVGRGPFEAHGRRSDTGSQVMDDVTQRIYDDAGVYRDRATDAVMFYSGDGHAHWHVRDLGRSTLTRKGARRPVGTGIKRGFCFYDNVPFPGTKPSGYAGCGNDQPDALEVGMGLSVGWGDFYSYRLPDQYINITGLEDGTYRLKAKADTANWFKESDEDNNGTWVDLRIAGETVTPIKYGPSAGKVTGS
jgi:hypothetical protein